MPKFKIILETTVSTVVDVVADSPEEAEIEVMLEGVPSLMFTDHTYPDVGKWEIVEVLLAWQTQGEGEHDE